ncbi:hypothetical protein [Cupriavidus pinatubonensis]|uniref:hypothetical protein n=1 Tax=Cupriavidus pinatubonensis TaxID=248026 RepID=UPI00112EA13B|nr:hypothetical protein [Cupriavidus pinatubonensis]TPQ43845.1 hypothetical protein C2U69_01635 [Cupriavidus pinatubonensis]
MVPRNDCTGLYSAFIASAFPAKARLAGLLPPRRDAITLIVLFPCPHLCWDHGAASSAGGCTNLHGAVNRLDTIVADTDPDALFRRVGYYDFRACTELTSSGLNQGFVLVRHHTLIGTVQTVFRAGKPQAQRDMALFMALEKLGQLAALAARDRLPKRHG